MKTYYISFQNKDYKVLIGQNATENDQLIKQSKQYDLWFHLNGIKSPHVILETQNDNMKKSDLRWMKTFFIDHVSNLPPNFTLIYTKIKNVQRTNIPGTVVPKCIEIIPAIHKSNGMPSVY